MAWRLSTLHHVKCQKLSHCFPRVVKSDKWRKDPVFGPDDDCNFNGKNSIFSALIPPSLSLPLVFLCCFWYCLMHVWIPMIYGPLKRREPRFPKKDSLPPLPRFANVLTDVRNIARMNLEDFELKTRQALGAAGKGWRFLFALMGFELLLSSRSPVLALTNAKKYSDISKATVPLLYMCAYKPFLPIGFIIEITSFFPGRYIVTEKRAIGIDRKLCDFWSFSSMLIFLVRKKEKNRANGP